MIIDKKLTRLDGSKVGVKSFISFAFIMNGNNVRFTLKHFINEKQEFKPIAGIKEFKYVILYTFEEGEEKPKNEEEFSLLLKKLIGKKINEQFIKL